MFSTHFVDTKHYYHHYSFPDFNFNLRCGKKSCTNQKTWKSSILLCNANTVIILSYLSGFFYNIWHSLIMHILLDSKEPTMVEGDLNDII
jgi:hypothetical protein